MSMPENTARTPPYKLLGLGMAITASVVLTLTYISFRGDLTPHTQLTLLSARAGLSLDPGSKVTFNGVQIGRVAEVEALSNGGQPEAKITLDVNDRYIGLIPRNVDAHINASTAFGTKNIVFATPNSPAAQSITSNDVIDVSSVTTEFNTLFETVVSIAKQVDPVELNQTLSAVAQALDGLGDKFGQSIVNGNSILDELNPRMPQIRYDTQRLADLADAYADATPALFDALEQSVITARTLNSEQHDLTAALVSAIGFANTGADIFERGGPYLVRGAADMLPTSELLDTNSPALLCTIRNFHDVAPKMADALGGNGYSLATHSELVGAGNPYVYPDNLPRVNARGGPGGAPGCWQPITRDLWPAPHLVMDTGASMAPYNHFELGQPILTEYVWGRQVGENTINP